MNLLAQFNPNKGKLCNRAEGIGGPRIAKIICQQKFSTQGFPRIIIREIEVEYWEICLSKNY